MQGPPSTGCMAASEWEVSCVGGGSEYTGTYEGHKSPSYGPVNPYEDISFKSHPACATRRWRGGVVIPYFRAEPVSPSH